MLLYVWEAAKLSVVYDENFLNAGAHQTEATQNLVLQKHNMKIRLPVSTDQGTVA